MLLFFFGAYNRSSGAMLVAAIFVFISPSYLVYGREIMGSKFMFFISLDFANCAMKQKSTLKFSISSFLLKLLPNSFNILSHVFSHMYLFSPEFFFKIGKAGKFVAEFFKNAFFQLN